MLIPDINYALDVYVIYVGVLTPPGALRVEEVAWKTLGASFPTFEYVITDEELNECVFESVDMFS